MYESLLYKMRMYNMDENSESRDLEQEEGRSSNGASKETRTKKKKNNQPVNVAKTVLEQGRVHSGESESKAIQHWGDTGDSQLNLGHDFDIPLSSTLPSSLLVTPFS